jgi:pullulanase/glycogen debranching enzyme
MLAFAQGTPMLRAGDEIGLTQDGNNNPYCQDNEITWHDWANADHDLAAFVAKLFEIRTNEPLLRWPRWFGHHDHSPKLRWLDANGCELHEAAWHSKDELAFSLTIDAGDHAVLLCLNPTPNAMVFHVSRVVVHGASNVHTTPHHTHGSWHLLLDSSLTLSNDLEFDTHVEVPARSVLLARSQSVPPPLAGEVRRG